MALTDPASHEQAADYNAGFNAWWAGNPLRKTKPKWWRLGWYAARAEAADMSLLDVAEKRAASKPLGAPRR